MRKTLGLGFLRSVTEKKVRNWAKTVVVLSLDCFAKILRSTECWCFAIAIDTATHNATCYFDIRVRVVVNGALRNYHLIACPFSGAHTGQNMFDLVQGIMGSLAGDTWTRKLIAVTTDGAANMVGRYRGVVSLLEKACSHSIYRVWCGAHQLDLVVQECVAKGLSETFYSKLTALINYLRRQPRLISELRSQCPTVSQTRWLSLGKVCRWIVRNRVAILIYLGHEESPPFEKPSVYWWLILYGVESLMHYVDICSQALQGKETVLAEQDALFDRLATDITDLFNLYTVRASNGNAENNPDEGDVVFTDGCVSATAQGVQSFFVTSGSTALSDLDHLHDHHRHDLFCELGELAVVFLRKVQSVRVERDSTNAAISTVPPPVLPGQVKDAGVRGVVPVIDQQRDRLLLTWSHAELGKLEDDLRFFLREAHRGSIPAQCLQTLFKDGHALQKAWAPISQKYSYLCRFCMGLATIFPGTATVEGDFSTINRVVSPTRSTLTDLSLQGIIYSTQFNELQKLKLWDKYGSSS